MFSAETVGYWRLLTEPGHFSLQQKMQTLHVNSILSNTNIFCNINQWTINIIT